MPDLIAMGVAWFLAWVFATAAMHKGRNLQHYRRLMGTYLNGTSVGTVVVWAFAMLELCTALLLLFHQSRPMGLLLAVLLLLGYACLMSLQLARGRADMKCGCAGPASAMTISPALIMRNLACAILAGLAMLPTITMAAGVTGLALALFVATFTTLIYLGSEQLIENAQQMAGER